MVIEPSLVIILLLLSQHSQDPLLFFGVELPVQYGYIAIVELVSGVAHEVLIEDDSLCHYFVLVFNVVMLDEGFAQMVCS